MKKKKHVCKCAWCAKCRCNELSGCLCALSLTSSAIWCMCVENVLCKRAFYFEVAFCGFFLLDTMREMKPACLLRHSYDFMWTLATVHYIIRFFSSFPRSTLNWLRLSARNERRQNECAKVQRVWVWKFYPFSFFASTQFFSLQLHFHLCALPYFRVSGTAKTLPSENGKNRRIVSRCHRVRAAQSSSNKHRNVRECSNEKN